MFFSGIAVAFLAWQLLPCYDACGFLQVSFQGKKQLTWQEIKQLPWQKKSPWFFSAFSVQGLFFPLVHSPCFCPLRSAPLFLGLSARSAPLRFRRRSWLAPLRFAFWSVRIFFACREFLKRRILRHPRWLHAPTNSDVVNIPLYLYMKCWKDKKKGRDPKFSLYLLCFVWLFWIKCIIDWYICPL